jgi:tripartite ATP-independent transporter DctM subunit
MEISLIGLGLLLAIAFLGLPLGFAMMAVGFVGFGLLRGWAPALTMVSQQILDLSLNYGFGVLPLFVLMGVFVGRSALSDDLYDTSNAWFGHFRGGLAMATVVACGGFAAISGSSVATAATMAKVAIPAMKRFDYADSLATGTVAAGGTLGILIPPSAAMIVYGLLTETDIAKLFVAGIVPGLMTVGLFVATVAIVTRFRPEIGPPGPRTAWPLRLRMLSRIWGVLVLFGIIIGGIFFGVFTPSEAGGIGAVGALAFALLRRRMTWALFLDSLVETGRITAAVFTVSFGALILNQFVNMAGLPTAMIGLVQHWHLTPNETVLLIILIYMVLGTVIEGFGMIFLTVPIFVPVVHLLGFDLVWFGIVVVMVVEMSMISPPIGLNVFVLKSMLPEIPLYTIFRGIVPFFLAYTVSVLLVLAVPSIVTFLPTLMG